MVLLHDISGKIRMHLLNLYFRAWKETTHLFFGNFSTTANISVSISNSVAEDHSCIIFVYFLHSHQWYCTNLRAEIKEMFEFEYFCGMPQPPEQVTAVTILIVFAVEPETEITYII
jgi:hypothetical protein